jgi:hypothetical protein
MTQGTEDIVTAISDDAGEFTPDTTQITAAPRYIVLDNMTEQTNASHFVCAPGVIPATEVGDTFIYVDDIFNTSGETIGHAIGIARVLQKHDTDGHPITQHEEIVEMQDGLVRAIGVFDRHSMLAGECVRLQAEGLSGRYAGMAGFREWQLIPPMSNRTVRMRIVLAG